MIIENKKQANNQKIYRNNSSVWCRDNFPLRLCLSKK